MVKLFEKQRPEEVFLPYAGEMPPDHVAAHLAATAAAVEAAGSAVVYEYGVWFWQHPPFAKLQYYAPSSALARSKENVRALYRMFTDFRTSIDVAPVLERKRAALACHVTQVERPDGDPDYRILSDIGDGDFLACFFRDHELLCRRDAHNR